MVTERALAVLFFTELATATVSPTVALSGLAPSDVADAHTVSCGFWLPRAVVAWAMGIATSSASPVKTISRTILNVVNFISYLLDFLASLAPGHPCEVIRVGGERRFDQARTSENAVRARFAEDPFHALR